MKFRIDPTHLSRVTPDRQRELEEALLDLNSEGDGAAPTLVCGLLPDGGIAFAVEDAEGGVAAIPLPYPRVMRLFREYKDVIGRLARADLGAFGMRDFETLDYAKKLVHDEAGTLLRKTLRAATAIDLAQARRLFTLVFLLSSDLPEEVIRTHRRHGVPT